MRKSAMARSRGMSAVALILAFTLGAPVLLAQGGESRVPFRPGLGADVFTRTISWDEDARESKLKTVLATVHGEVQLAEGFVVGLFAGYGLTNPNGLIFRGLPFSIDYEAGGIGAVLVGADLLKTLFRTGNFEIGLRAGYERSLAAKSSLEITSLNQAGTAEAKSSWQRVTAGPLVRYLGYEKFSPFLALSFDKLWGEFSMTEAIFELKGSETKSVAGKGLVGISLGTDFEPSPGVRLKGEVTAIPYKKLAGGLDVDYGIALRAIFGI
jgi:hypothetical protein